MLDKPNVITAARAIKAEPSQFADKTLAWQDPDLQSSLPLRLTWIRLWGLLIPPTDCFFWLHVAGFGTNTREVLYLHSWDTGGKLTLHGGHCPRCVARLAHALCCCPQMLSSWILKEQKLGMLETSLPVFYTAHILNVSASLSYIITVDRHYFVFLFRRLRKSSPFCLSVRPSAWNNSAPSGGIFMKFDIWVFSENLSRKFKFH
jgi:hypothetical protein